MPAIISIIDADAVTAITTLIGKRISSHIWELESSVSFWGSHGASLCTWRDQAITIQEPIWIEHRSIVVILVKSCLFIGKLFEQRGHHFYRVIGRVEVSI